MPRSQAPKMEIGELVALALSPDRCHRAREQQYRAALAEAMARLGGDPQLGARYAAAARKLVVERFAAEIIGRQTVALYRRAVEQTSV